MSGTRYRLENQGRAFLRRMRLTTAIMINALQDVDALPVIAHYAMQRDTIQPAHQWVNRSRFKLQFH